MDTPGRNDSILTVTIETSQGSWTHDFPKTAKVEDVLKQVIAHFGFAADGKYDLRLSTDPTHALKPERTLVSYGVKDGAVLVFTELGNAA